MRYDVSVITAPGIFECNYVRNPNEIVVTDGAVSLQRLQIIIRTAHITLNLGITVLVVMLDPLEVVAYSLLTSTPVVPVSQMFI